MLLVFSKNQLLTRWIQLVELGCWWAQLPTWGLDSGLSDFSYFSRLLFSGSETVIENSPPLSWQMAHLPSSLSAGTHAGHV